MFKLKKYILIKKHNSQLTKIVIFRFDNVCLHQNLALMKEELHRLQTIDYEHQIEIHRLNKIIDELNASAMSKDFELATMRLQTSLAFVHDANTV